MDHEAIKKSKAALYVIFKWQSTGYCVYAGLTCVKLLGIHINVYKWVVYLWKDTQETSNNGCS